MLSLSAVFIFGILHVDASFKQEIWKITQTHGHGDDLCIRSSDWLINTRVKLKALSSCNTLRAPWVRKINDGSKAPLSPGKTQFDSAGRSTHLSVSIKNACVGGGGGRPRIHHPDKLVHPHKPGLCYSLFQCQMWGKCASSLSPPPTPSLKHTQSDRRLCVPSFV